MAKKIVAVKTKPAARKPAAKTAAAKKAPLTVSIDYPQEGEDVRHGHYSIRVTAAGASSAQCRFNGGDWVDCREAVGHFWLDWMCGAGKIGLEARARSGKGRWTLSPARAVVIAAPV